MTLVHRRATRPAQSTATGLVMLSLLSAKRTPRAALRQPQRRPLTGDGPGRKKVPASCRAMKDVPACRRATAARLPSLAFKSAAASLLVVMAAAAPLHPVVRDLCRHHVTAGFFPGAGPAGPGASSEPSRDSKARRLPRDAHAPVSPCLPSTCDPCVACSRPCKGLPVARAERCGGARCNLRRRLGPQRRRPGRGPRPRLDRSVRPGVRVDGGGPRGRARRVVGRTARGEENGLPARAQCSQAGRGRRKACKANARAGSCVGDAPGLRPMGRGRPLRLGISARSERRSPTPR